MNKEPALKSATPLNRNNDLLDAVIAKKKLKNDAQLSHFLKVAPPVISKIRHGRLPIGDSMLVKIHEFADMAFSEIRRFIPRAV